MTILIVAAILAWWIVGVTGFIYWWTTEHDLETFDVLFALWMGVLGPLAWIVGRVVHGGPRKPPRVWVRQR